MAAEDQLSAFGAARRLRTALRRARDACAIKQADVAAAMDWSPSKLMRIESGAVSISSNDLRALCRHYGIGPSIVEQLVQYQQAALQRPWWYEFKADIPPALGTLIDLESEANTIRIFAAAQVPGLLQTKAYAGEIAKLGLQLARGEEPSGSFVQTMVAIQVHRQQLLGRADAPIIEVLLDEAVLFRCVGSATGMAEQVLWLAELARRPNVDLRIFPFEVGPVLPSGDFVLVDVQDESPVMYQDTIAGGNTTEIVELVASHEDLFLSVWKRGLDPSRTNHLLHRTAAQYASGGHARPWL